MATLTATRINSNVGASAVTVNTLTDADTFKDLGATAKQMFIFTNPTAAAITVKIKGDQATGVVPAPGFGAGVDVSAGFDIPLAAGESKKVFASDIRNFLSDSEKEPDITGAENATCILLEW